MVAWGNEDPSSYGWPRMPGADLVPFTYRGHPFPGGVARLMVPVFTACLDRICAQPGFQLPASTGLDAGMWGASNRKKTSGNGWSIHAYGLAIDVCAPWNPYGSRTPPPSPHRLPLNTDELVRPLGVMWGGGVHGFSDWMHLQGHLSPDEARGFSQPALFSPTAPPWLLPAGWYFGPRSGPNASVSNMVNARGDWVSSLQQAQRRLGVDADGLYGPITGRAVRAYQATHGLVADGLLGPKTWASLFS